MGKESHILGLETPKLELRALKSTLSSNIVKYTGKYFTSYLEDKLSEILTSNLFAELIAYELSSTMLWNINDNYADKIT